MNIGIVTCADFPALTDQEKPLVDLFAANRIRIAPLVWNDAHVDWKNFDCLILRSIWDYHLHIDDFFDWLNRLRQQQVRTLNSMEVVHWNRHKFYLRELAQKGVLIIPTLFFEKGSVIDPRFIENQGWDQAVIKPAVSANAHLTESFCIKDAAKVAARFQQLAKNRDWIVQSFMSEVTSNGEVSLIFINKQFSHAVLKTPAEGDFRVQADYGGRSVAYRPSQQLIDAGKGIISHVPHPLLYARVDGVVRNTEFYLMELELIEPELFFHLAPGSAERLVSATLDILKSDGLR